MTIYVSDDIQTHSPELEAYTLLRQINAMLDIFNRYDLRGEDLTVPQFTILSHATPEGVPLSEISARMLCDNSNLTGIVDRLISKGLVERKPDPQDRRVSLICLTSAGAEKLRNIRPRHHSSVSQRMNSLSEEEVQQLRDLLGMLRQGLEHNLKQGDSVGTAVKYRTTGSNGAHSTNGNNHRGNHPASQMSIADSTIASAMSKNGRGNNASAEQ
jgi:DNA-binding MarR family transcriptional regulator